MSFEVEFKFAVADPDEFLKRLTDLNPAKGKLVTQRDTYFAHPVRNFGETNEAFRLRSTGPENWLTYKGPLIDEISKTRREIELPVGKGDETAASFTEMLQLLGFQPVRTVSKERQYFHLNWQGRPVEITLDSIAGLGTFAELEGQAEEAEVPAVRKSLQKLATSLHLENSIRKSYLCLLMELETENSE